MDLQEIDRLSERYASLNSDYENACVSLDETGNAVYSQTEYCINLRQLVKEAYTRYREALGSYESSDSSTGSEDSGNSVSVEPVCGVVRDQVIAYIEYYADKFPKIVTPVLENTDDTGTTITGPSQYNQTKYDLNKVGNKIIRIIGGSLLPESFEQEYFSNTPDDTMEGDSSIGQYQSESTEGDLVPNIKEVFTEIFKDFTYDNANMAGGEALLSREEVETASYWKVAAIGKIDECRFTGKSGVKILEGITRDFDTLAEASAYLDAQAKYLSDGNGIKNRIITILKELIEFYRELTKRYSEITIYSSKCDYMTHQYYEDENAWAVINNWVPEVGEIMQTAEDTVPEVVNEQTEDLSGVIEDIEKVAHKLKDNDSISLIETLREEASYQYLSKYVEYYGARLAEIIRSMMSGVDNKDYDIDLIDELTLIEQRLQQQLTTAASRMTILNRSVFRYKNIKNFSATNSDIVSRLRDAVLGLSAHNNK